MALPAYESVTVTDTAIGFSQSIWAGNYCQTVTVTLETAPIRFRIDGTDPISTEGHLMQPGQSATVKGAAITKFKAIRTGGTSGVLKCSFE